MADNRFFSGYSRGITNVSQSSRPREDNNTTVGLNPTDTCSANTRNVYPNRTNDNLNRNASVNSSGSHMDQFVSDVLEFVRGIMEESPSLDMLTQSFNTHRALASSSSVPTDKAQKDSDVLCVDLDCERTISENIHQENIVIKTEIDTESESSWLGPDEMERIRSHKPLQNSPQMDGRPVLPSHPSGHFRYENPDRSPTLILSPRHSCGTLSPFQDGNSSDGQSMTIDGSRSSFDLSNKQASDVEEDGKMVTRQCQVCNDAASGFHYGVWSCEGCKAFFKRSLQGPVNYVCPATNNCTIDKHRRKSCQSCRLHKCMQSGMSRGNCREKKGPHLRQTKRKSQELDAVNPKQPMMSPPYHESSPLVKKEPLVCSVRPLVDPDSRPIQPQYTPSHSQPEANPIHPLVSHLLNIDPPTRYANHEASWMQHTPESMLTLLLKVANNELVDIVNWARAIPGYMELMLRDRMQLLELSWMEILLLGLFWRSMPHQDHLVFAPDWHVSREDFRLFDSSNLHQKALMLVASFKQQQITREEMVLLRTSVLLNAGVQNLSNEKYFQELQDKVHNALYYTIVQRGKHPYSRMTRILLLLPQLRQLSLEAIALLTQLKQHDQLPSMASLIGEILSSQNGITSLLS